jgi:hypothetical protein
MYVTNNIQKLKKSQKTFKNRLAQCHNIASRVS